MMKFLKVDMKTATVSSSEVPQEYIGLGGRGLTSLMINNEVPPKCDPLTN
jgi:aldehyde:ferredoxin oxidoreductase